MHKPIIAIIGGGAAGMMAAATIIESHAPCDIHVFDANTKLGVKVLISGGGRCNVTTGMRDPHVLKKQYIRGAQFLKAALSKFTPAMVYEWFEQHGVPLKTESDMRVFPQSNDGKDVVGVFEKLFARHGVTTHFSSRVESITKNAQFHIQTKQETLKADYVLIATGGNAYRKTGSTGDGYHFAQQLGHTITPLGPSLNSFFVNQEWPKQLSGIALPHARLTTKHAQVDGPFLFTHFGISGPVTFALSAHIAYEPIDREHPITVFLHPHIDAHWNSILKDTSSRGKNTSNPYLRNSYHKD